MFIKPKLAKKVLQHIEKRVSGVDKVYPSFGSHHQAVHVTISSHLHEHTLWCLRVIHMSHWALLLVVTATGRFGRCCSSEDVSGDDETPQVIDSISTKRPAVGAAPTRGNAVAAADPNGVCVLCENLGDQFVQCEEPTQDCIERSKGSKRYERVETATVECWPLDGIPCFIPGIGCTASSLSTLSEQHDTVLNGTTTKNWYFLREGVPCIKQVSH
jgi:hypothetical protein